MGAAGTDREGIAEERHEKVASASLRTVPGALGHLVHDTGVRTETATLLILGRNDSDAATAAERARVAEHPGNRVPLRPNAFHPDSAMQDVPPAPRRARRIAPEAGFEHARTGSVRDREGRTTTRSCGEALIVHDCHRIDRYAVSDSGHCGSRGARVPGVFEDPAGDWGPKRQPIRIPAPSL